MNYSPSEEECLPTLCVCFYVCVSKRGYALPSSRTCENVFCLNRNHTRAPFFLLLCKSYFISYAWFSFCLADAEVIKRVMYVVSFILLRGVIRCSKIKENHRVCFMKHFSFHLNKHDSHFRPVSPPELARCEIFCLWYVDN